MQLQVYSLDANVLIQIANTTYPKDLFPSVWEKIKEEMNKGNIKVIEFVYDEVMDETFKFDFKAYEKYFLLPISEMDKFEEIEYTASELINKREKLIDNKKGKNDADPWLVAHGEAYGYTIVSCENFDVNQPMIPTLCAERGIKCIQPLDFFREIGLSI